MIPVKNGQPLIQKSLTYKSYYNYTFSLLTRIYYWLTIFLISFILINYNRTKGSPVSQTPNKGDLYE